jgi:hypothetical protein
MKKLLSYLSIAIKAIAQFLAFPYASEITIGVVAVVIFLFHLKFWGVALLVWGVLLFINQFNKNKQKKVVV